MLSFIIPTRDRTAELNTTLRALSLLDERDLARAGGAELIIIDNASRTRAHTPAALTNHMRITRVDLKENVGAAARNIGARAAVGDWLIMLDDDSAPINTNFIDALTDAPSDVAAIGAEITLPSGAHEAGGLPEVIIGCGAAIRKNAFLKVGAYDGAFHFYAEEYDLCAKLLLAGYRVKHDQRFRVEHAKTLAGRDMNMICARLVRNNGWVIQRYAPESVRDRAIEEVVTRYQRIAEKENALAGYERGLSELNQTIASQPRDEMSTELWDRFTGLAAARAGFREHGKTLRFGSSSGGGGVAIVDRGKNDWAVEQALRECGVELVADIETADTLVIGTLSPGPMLDAQEKWLKRGRRALTAWRFSEGRCAVKT